MAVSHGRPPLSQRLDGARGRQVPEQPVLVLCDRRGHFDEREDDGGGLGRGQGRVSERGGAERMRQDLALQRHLRVLTKFAHIEPRLSGRLRRREVIFYKPVNPCDRRVCSTSVAVGLIATFLLRFLRRMGRGPKT